MNDKVKHAYEVWAKQAECDFEELVNDPVSMSVPLHAISKMVEYAFRYILISSGQPQYAYDCCIPLTRDILKLFPNNQSVIFIDSSYGSITNWKDCNLDDIEEYAVLYLRLGPDIRESVKKLMTMFEDYKSNGE